MSTDKIGVSPDPPAIRRMFGCVVGILKDPCGGVISIVWPNCKLLMYFDIDFSPLFSRMEMRKSKFPDAISAGLLMGV